MIFKTATKKDLAEFKQHGVQGNPETGVLFPNFPPHETVGLNSASPSKEIISSASPAVELTKDIANKIAFDNSKHANGDTLANKEESTKKQKTSFFTNKNTEYAGDTIDSTRPLRGEEQGWKVLEFDSPFDVVSFYNKSIAEGKVILHPWQLDVTDELARQHPTSLEPYKFILCACNGSGKDAFVIAPFAIWFALTKKQSRCIITSASGVQLTSQTENYIRNLAHAVNEFHGEEIFKIRQRFIRCMLSGSEIRLFATDEEGKAEGYHPIEPNAEMAIIINESKSVATEIHRALRRCTGFNYWIEVSTPGPPHGEFYNHFTNWPHKRHITTFDCPHLSGAERESDLIELGEHSSLYRSKHLALFTSEEGQCIIPIEVIDRVRLLSKTGHIKWNFQSWPLRIGLDLAAGGDENVITTVKGNKILQRYCFREKDTTVTAQRINHILGLELALSKDHNYIFADDGGVGRGIIDQLVAMGWSVGRVLNQSSTVGDKKTYRNRGAEMWYRAKRIIEENVFLLEGDDEKFFNQLCSRFYKQESAQGRITLESKAEAKANGRPSPDRADSFILALTGLTIRDFLGEKSHEEEKQDPNPFNNLHNRTGFKTVVEINQWNESEIYKEYQNAMNGQELPQGDKLHGSMTSFINRRAPRRLGSNKQLTYTEN